MTMDEDHLFQQDIEQETAAAHDDQTREPCPGGGSKLIVHGHIGMGKKKNTQSQESDEEQDCQINAADGKLALYHGSDDIYGPQRKCSYNACLSCGMFL